MIICRMSKFDKAEKPKSISGFRDQLKSTGQSKFALEEEDKVGGASVGIIPKATKPQ